MKSISRRSLSSWSHLLIFVTLTLLQRSCFGYLVATDNSMTRVRTRFHGLKHVQSSKQITSGTTALNALPIAIGPTVASALVVAGVIAFHEGNYDLFVLSLLTLYDTTLTPSLPSSRQLVISLLPNLKA